MKTIDIMEDVIEIRRNLHKHPELSTKEFQTQKIIMKYLDEYGIRYDITTVTGVVGYINKGKEGPCIALRADIDALPIQEQNKTDYTSVNDGVMHACGHDAHTSILLGVGRILNERKDELQGSVKLIFQPDEEQSGGAKRVVQEGFLDDVDYVLGLHVMPYLEVGDIEVRDGALCAETGTLRIEIQGKGTHAAYPEKGIDSIVVASHLITEIQSIFTRNISPLEQTVLSFGKIYGGVKSNIIADKVVVEGTLRTLNKEIRQTIIKRIQEVCRGVGISQRATITPYFSQGYPPLINDVFVNQHIVDNASKMESIQTIHVKEHPSMGGEDFGYYQEKAKGAFFHVGCGNKQKNIQSHLHTETFDIDEECLQIGIELQVLNVFSLLNGEIK